MVAKNLGQQALIQLGVLNPNDIGTGGATRALQSLSPAQRAQFNQMIGGKSMGGQAPVYNAGGVDTIGQIEPFNQYQRSALTSLGTGVTEGNALLGSAAASAQRGASPFDLERYSQLQNAFMNPYQQQVVDRSIDAVNREAARAQNALTAGFGSRAGRGGGMSFGDSASAIQQAELERNRLNTVGDTTAALNQAGYTQTQNAALGAMGSEMQNALLGGQLMGDIAGQQRGFALGDINNRLLAGDRIQQQNQNALTATWNEYNRLKGYGQNQLTGLGTNLNAFPMSGSATSGQAPNNMGILGGALMAGAPMIGGYFGANSDINAAIRNNTGGIF